MQGLMLHISEGRLAMIQVVSFSLSCRMTLFVSVKMQNKKGPLGKLLEPLEQFQRSLYQEHESSREGHWCATNMSVDLLHLPKRISNIEQYLGINQGSMDTL